MVRTGAFGRAVLVLLAGTTFAARIQKKTTTGSTELAKSNSESAASCPAGIAEFKTFSTNRKIKRKCGQPLWGTVYVGILSAHDLVSTDWFSASDPYARFRISDKHLREMRGFWSKEKPVPVTDDLVTEYKSNDNHPEWMKTFAFDFLCPQMPFGPNDAPLGPKPPIVISHPSGVRLNKGKSGHEFQVELTIKDSDVNTDDSLGRVKVPVMDIVNGKHDGLTTYQLIGAQGSVDMLFWYCPKDDAQCEADREAEWKEHNAPVRVMKREQFDCEMGCHTLLNPTRGRLARYVQAAETTLRRAIGSAENATRFENDQRKFDSASDSAAIAAFASTKRNETLKLQEDWAKFEKLEEEADKKGDLAQQNRERSWAEAVSLSKQLAAFEGLGAQFCSASPVFGDVLRWAAVPLFNYVFDPSQNFLNNKYNDDQARWLLQALNNLRGRMQEAETCLRTRWFDDSQLVVNQWETTPKCHSYFNVDA